MTDDAANRRSRLLVAATLCAAGAVLSALLLRPPIVGLADNGDFDRVMLPAGLLPESPVREDRFFGWMQPRFLYGPRTADVSGFRTSEALLVDVAVDAARRLSKAPFFDVRFLGVVHGALLLLALGLLVAACGELAAAAQATAAVLLVFFFTDPGYVSPFQSLYSQTASLLFLLLTAGVVAAAIRRGGLRGLAVPAYFLAAALFVCSKPQESVQALLLAPLGLRLAWSGSRRARIAALLLALCLGGLAWRYYRSSQASSGWLTRYNVLFVEILPHSPDPAADLVELGLDPSLVSSAGISAWVPGSAALRPEVRTYLEARRGEPSPRSLYLRHPERLVGTLSRAFTLSFVLQPPGLGHFAKESGAAKFSQAFSPWSDFRARLSGWPVLLVLFGGTLLAAAATWRRASPRGRLAREALAVLVAMAAGAFIVAAIGDWHRDLDRHLYAFHAMCDLLIAADAAWIVQALVARRTTAVTA